MTWTVRILLTLLTIAGLTTDIIPTEAEAAAAPAGIAVEAANLLGEVAPLTADQINLVAATNERFAEAGLSVPNNVVPSFHDSTDACNGNLGLSTIEDGTPRIRICWSHENPDVAIRLQEQVLVHELAHAWADENLNDARKAAFVEFSGAESWSLAATDWEHRGTERAADLITWALLDPAVLFVDFADMSCHTWGAAFELLTDTPAPATLTEAC